MSSRDTLHRSILPIPDPQHVGLTTYDAKDPDTKFPPIEPLRPPKGAPNVLIVLIDDCGFGAVERIRRPDHHADRRAAGEGRAEVQPLPHDRAVLAHAPGAAHRTQSPFGEHGRHLRNRDLGARLHLGAAEEQGAAGDDAQAQWLLDRAVRQVPRGAGLADEPDWARSTNGPRAAADSNTSTASSAAKPTSGTPPSTRARRRWNRTRRPRRATTSPRT